MIKLQQEGNINKQNKINETGHRIQILDNSMGNKIEHNIIKQLKDKKIGQNIHGNDKLNIHILYNIQEKRQHELINFLHSSPSYFLKLFNIV